MLKRVLMLAGATLIAVAVSFIAIARTSAQGPVPGPEQPITPQYLIIPDLGVDEPIPLELVPLAIRAIAQQGANAYVQGAQIASATFDTEGPVPTYELAGAGANGQAFEVDVFQDGMLEEVEVVISAGEVPAAVTQALNTYLPNFSPDLVERSVRPQHTGLTVVYYEFGGQNAAGDPIDVEVREDGAKLVIEEDTPDTPTPTPVTPSPVTTTPTRTATPSPIPTTPTTATPTTGTATATSTVTPTTGTVTPTLGTATPITGTVTPTLFP